MSEHRHTADIHPPDGNQQATPWHNVYGSFLISQANARLHEDIVWAYAVSHPDGFKAMCDVYSATNEETLTAIDQQLRRPYQNDLSHPGRVKESEFRQRGTDTLLAALGNAQMLVEMEPGATQVNPGFLLRIASRMADRDAHFLNRPERRNKPESGDYSLLRANSASHLLHYMFLDERSNYPRGSIMHLALDAAVTLRQQIEEGRIAPNSQAWSARCQAFRTHLQTYPDHISRVSETFSRFVAEK